MATFRIVCNSTALRTEKVRSTKGRYTNVSQLVRFFRGLLIGAANGTVTVEADASKTAATGTVTLASVSNNDTVTLGSVTITAKTASPTGNQFLVGVSDTADALALATFINAHATLSLYWSASSALGVVTITAIGKMLGVIGNFPILSSSNNTRLAVVAFASGADDSSSVSHTF
jgi:hypothetical protein